MMKQYGLIEMIRYDMIDMMKENDKIWFDCFDFDFMISFGAILIWDCSSVRVILIGS